MDNKQWKQQGKMAAAGFAMGAMIWACSNLYGPGEPLPQSGQQEPAAASAESAGEERQGETVRKEVWPEDHELVLRDNPALYEADDEDSVVTMYLTVRRGTRAEGTDHTWQEINQYSAYDYQEMGVDRYQVEAILQVGDDQGPLAGEVGYGERVANATVQIRGQTSSRNAQKNYKIRLKDNKGTWRGQQTIALNKHQTDGLRFRNKLGFDLMKGIDQIMSLRTQFVHLYVKDETEGRDGGFVDYGLYTQVEQLNKKALLAHGLDRNGHLYKINFFEFFRYEDTIRLATDPQYDLKAFEKLLEVKGNQDHSKLIRMLEDLNEYTLDIEEVLDKHFNRENLTYWLAFNILTGNIDTQNRNVYLYSPQNMDTWYFLPWDLDAFLRVQENQIKGRVDFGSWERGVSNYWGNVLFQRCLKSSAFRQELDAAILDLKEYLSPERIRGLTDQYRVVTKPYLSRQPDIGNASLNPEDYDQIADGLSDLVEVYYQNYLESLEYPLPFYIGVPYVEDGKLVAEWDISYDFQNEDITYHAVLARDHRMEDVVDTYEGIWPKMETEELPPGKYFIRVTATDASGNTQDAFDYYVTEVGKTYGVKCFYVEQDETIVEDIYEE